MRRDVIQQRYRCERAARAVRIALIPTGLGRALRRHNAVFVEDMINLNIFSTNTVAPQRTESSVCLAPRSFRGSRPGARAGGRHADTTGTFHRQHALLKAAACELASRLWDLPPGRRVLA